MLIILHVKKHAVYLQCLSEVIHQTTRQQNSIKRFSKQYDYDYN